MPKFTTEEFLASSSSSMAAIRTPKANRVKRTHTVHTESTGPIAPPSPLFSGVNENNLESEPFPDLMDPSEPNTDLTLEHCVLHCDHQICSMTKEQDHKYGREDHQCKCHLEPKVSEPARPTPPIKITKELLQHATEVCRSFSPYTEITIYETDIQDLLPQFKTIYKRCEAFMQLGDQLTALRPGEEGLNAVADAYIFFFRELSHYFTRSIGLHGDGDQKQTVQVNDLHTEIRNCMFATMLEFIAEHRPGLLSREDMRAPGSAKKYIHQGIPKLVWGFWVGIWEELLMVLEWRHVQLTNTITDTVADHDSGVDATENVNADRKLRGGGVMRAGI